MIYILHGTVYLERENISAITRSFQYFILNLYSLEFLVLCSVSDLFSFLQESELQSWHNGDIFFSWFATYSSNAPV